MAKIFLSVPILGKPELKMIYSTYQAILSSSHQVRIYFNENDSLISRVRNVHISTFLYDFPEYDYFMSLDSDIEVLNAYKTNNIFSKLVAHDLEFVGGLYSIKKQGQTKCSSILIDPKDVQFNSGVVEVRWLSSGCWCIKRSVVEKMAAAYPELTYNGDDNAAGKTIHGLYIPMIYDLRVGEFGSDKPFRKYLSEDWSFPVHPHTEILCEDFQWKKIKNLHKGETVIAFDENPIGQKRQLRKATIERIIFKKLPRFKIITEEGEVITTEDHKWLIKRGWRLQGRRGRKNGSKTEHPSKSYWEQTKNIKRGDYIYKPFYHVNCMESFLFNNRDYAKGYVSGVWDGDGNISKHKKWNNIRATLRVCDMDILKKTQGSLSQLGIVGSLVNTKVFSNIPKHKDLHCLYIKSKGENLKKFLSIFEAQELSPIFCKGYLAGIYDAEGNYDGASITISQYAQNKKIRQKIKKALNILKYKFKEDSKRFRITGCRQVYKFFMETQPSLLRKMHLLGQKKGNGNLVMPQHKTKVLDVIDLKEKGEMICLVTDTSTFIANGFASHNCERWRKIGGRIFADTSIALNHIGKHDYKIWNVQPVQKQSTPPPGFELEQLGGGNDD